MANTFRSNCLRKLLSSCCLSRQSLHRDDSRAIGSHSSAGNSNGSRKGPRRPGKSHPTAPHPARNLKTPIAKPLGLHSVVSSLGSSKKDKRGLPFVCNKRRRDKPKRLESQDSGNCSRANASVPLKIFKLCKSGELAKSSSKRKMCWREVKDSVAIRNFEKMVRESQSRLLNRRVRDLFDGWNNKESQEDVVRHKITRNDKAAQGSLESKEKGDKDVRISRMQTTMELEGRRPRKCSTESSRDPLLANHAYHMRVACYQAIRPKENPIRTESKTKNLQGSSSTATFNLLQQEQKRLDILKAEWQQLKGLEKSARLGQRPQTKGSTKPTDPNVVAPTDLDLESLIVDPKSFLTKVHVKSQILPVDLGDNTPVDTLVVENPDVSSHTSKDGHESEPDEGLLKPVPH